MPLGIPITHWRAAKKVIDSQLDLTFLTGTQYNLIIDAIDGYEQNLPHLYKKTFTFYKKSFCKVIQSFPS